MIDRSGWRFRVAYAIGSVGHLISWLASRVDADGAICVGLDSLKGQLEKLEARGPVRFELAAFALLQAGDVLTTVLALGNGAHEANPFVAAALVYGGWNALAGLKIWLVALVCGVAYLLPSPLLAPMRGALLVGNVAMAFVVLSNAGLALR